MVGMTTAKHAPLSATSPAAGAEALQQNLSNCTPEVELILVSVRSVLALQASGSFDSEQFDCR
jgi:hypothetical protein